MRRPLACVACSETRADTETGPGVFETALAYTDALRMADNAILFKLLAKSVGIKHGIMPSFMAKPWGNVRPPCRPLACLRLEGSCRGAPGTRTSRCAPRTARTCLRSRTASRARTRSTTTPSISARRPSGSSRACSRAWRTVRIVDLICSRLTHAVVPLLVPTINGYKRLVGGEVRLVPVDGPSPDGARSRSGRRTR